MTEPRNKAGAFLRLLDRLADRARDNDRGRALVPEVVLRDAAAIIREAAAPPALDDLLWWAEHMALPGDERFIVDLADTDAEADRRYELSATLNNPVRRLAWLRAALSTGDEK